MVGYKTVNGLQVAPDESVGHGLPTHISPSQAL